ncbi:MAG: S8 family serine peptidase [Phycisphaerales bacterium]|nr:S8 family serine peptidase [Phycisphaerales bacterium]
MSTAPHVRSSLPIQTTPDPAEKTLSSARSRPRRVASIGLAAAAMVLLGGSSARAGDERPRRAGAVIYRVNPAAGFGEMLDAAVVMTRVKMTKETTLAAMGVDVGVAELEGMSEEELCAELVRTGAALWAEPDYLLPLATTPNDPFYGNQWQHTRINSPAAWDITTGASSVLVAVCDTGVQGNHPDLAANLQLPGYNSVDGSTDTEPINQHGTFCAGCISAVGNNSTGVAGVAWNVKILPVKISNISSGSAYLTDMAEGVQWAADNGAKVINLSYAGFENASIDAAATYARSQGALLLMAAGNDGANLTGQPDWSSFLLVGSTDSSDARSTFSNYGTPIDIVAPGTSVVSTTMGSSYASGSGTSYATPIAVGVAALMLSANSNLTVAQLETRLMSSCDDIGPAGDDSFFGRGRVNAYNAVVSATQGSHYPAEMSSPTEGATLSGASQTFAWVAGGGASQYWLSVGSGVGLGNYHNATAGLGLSATVSTLPVDGSTVYVRLSSLIAGAWQYNDYTYTACTSGSARAVMTSPSNGATLTSASQAFAWSAGDGASQYWLSLGSYAGGANYVSANMGLALAANVTNLPTDGSTLYVRLWTRTGVNWLYNDYTYTLHTAATTPAAMTSPADGATLSGASQTFQWSAGSGALQYWLMVGGYAGGGNYLNANMGLNQTAGVSGLPVDGSTIYVRLWTRIAATWHYNDYTYTAHTGSLTPAAMTSPANGSTLAGASVTFQWSGQPEAQQYWLDIGAAPGLRTYFSGSAGLSTSRTVSTLPTNGSAVHVRLHTRYGTTWVHNDYAYTAAGP